MNRFLIILFIFSSLVANASPRDCLIVHFTDGSYVVFPLEQSPRVTFDGGVVQIADQRYQVSNVRKYTIGDSDHAGIKSIDDGENSSNYSFDDDCIVVKMASPSQNIRLHTLDGVEIPIHAQPDIHGYLRIPHPQQSGRVYLLTIGSETIKIRRP